MKPIVEIDSHGHFLEWVNEVVRKSSTTPAMKILCSHLNEIILCRQLSGKDPEPFHAAARSRILYDEIMHYLSNAVETLKLESAFDPERIFDKESGIRAAGPENRIKLQLLAMIQDGGYTRLGKCLWCEKYFFAHRSADVQRFCNKPNKKTKSPCAVAWHTEQRRQRNRKAAERQKRRRKKAADAKRNAMEQRLCEIVNQHGGLRGDTGRYELERAVQAQLVKEGFNKLVKDLPPFEIRKIYQRIS